MIIKRLFVDIETSGNMGWFWRAGYDLDIPYQNILTERQIICICYGWYGEKKIHSLKWGKDDKKMVAAFLKVARTADEIVGHNIDRFDIPWIRTRALIHGIETPDFKTVDTLKWAKKLYFNSNKLDYVAKRLGVGQKIKNDPTLWFEVAIKKDKVALDKMVRYCENDVKINIKVFDKLKNLFPAKTHATGVKIDCPECGGPTRKMQRRISAAGTVRIQRVCKNCGKFHTTSK
jgi:DNA polymerase elongation subunit (family B)